MPQMGPLPWMLLWASILLLMMILLIFMFYIAFYKIKLMKSNRSKENYSWKW